MHCTVLGATVRVSSYWSSHELYGLVVSIHQLDSGCWSPRAESPEGFGPQRQIPSKCCELGLFILRGNLEKIKYFT